MKMTNKLFLLGAAVAFCACSNEEVVAPEINIENSEVAIQLGSSDAVTVTRAAVTNENKDLAGIGVWCLAKDVMQENLNPQDIKWFGTQPENLTCCIMKNVKSSVKNGNVRWDDPNAQYFYPQTQFYRYEFYANYPYTTNLTYSQTSVSASYTIDGTQDLIWGRATSEEDYAWSAKYFRVNGGQTETNRPKLKLEHLLTRLVFFVQPGAQVEIEGASEDEMDYTAARSMIIDTLQICDASTRLTMNVANFNRLDMSIGDRLIRSSSKTDTLYLKDASGAIVNPKQVPSLPSLKEQWGESIMLFPSNQYTIRVVLHDNAGHRFCSEIPLVLANQPNGFERGKSYNITVTVHGATSPTLGAELTDWEEVEGPSLNL